MQKRAWTSIREFYLRHDRWWPILFFFGGFLYDILSLDEIDSLFGIFKHVVYLISILGLIALETFVYFKRLEPKGRWIKAWPYQELLIHFLLGSLLSEYTLFFFKSASIWSTFAFVAILAGVLIVNEFKRFQGNSGIAARTTLFAICLVSFFAYVIPVLIGFVGWLPFAFALTLSSLVGYQFFKWLKNRLGEHEPTLKRQILYPFAGTIGVFAFLYVTKLIPPIPVAVQYMGIFREVGKEDGEYRLLYDRGGWRFWQNGEQTFHAKPGDRPLCFVRIFSPGSFKDEVRLRWLFKDPRQGWLTADTIPIRIMGGREKGFRGYTYKNNYQPGDWQVRAETSDGRELGRIYFKIESVDAEYSLELAVEHQ